MVTRGNIWTPPPSANRFLGFSLGSLGPGCDPKTLNHLELKRVETHGHRPKTPGREGKGREGVAFFWLVLSVNRPSPHLTLPLERTPTCPASPESLPLTLQGIGWVLLNSGIAVGDRLLQRLL